MIQMLQEPARVAELFAGWQDTMIWSSLIFMCLERGLYPSWDAQNRASAVLAEKLGYHFSHVYPVYEISYDQT